MKKIHKTAFALLFTLTICVPDLFVVSAEGHGSRKVVIKMAPRGRGKAVITRQNIAQVPLKQRLKKQSELRELALRQRLDRAEKEADRVKEELARIRETERLSGFTLKAQRLISETHFMVVCPTQSEFLSVYNSLISSNNFKKRDDISADVISELKERLYGRDKKDFVMRIQAPNGVMSSSEVLLQPICFFDNEQRATLCLAWCGKGFVSATSFVSNSEFFGNSKHALICGICGCANRSIKPSNALFCTKYVTLSGNAGDPFFAGPKGPEIYIQSGSAYYTKPMILSCGTSSLFRELSQTLDVALIPAMNFSFDFFVEDTDLAKSIESRALQYGLAGCIDMEGVPLAKQFHERGCTVHSLRIVSDHAEPRTKGFSKPDGRQKALEELERISGSIIGCWMAHEFKRSDELSAMVQAKKRPGVAPGYVISQESLPFKVLKEEAPSGDCTPVRRCLSTSVLPAVRELYF